MSTIELGSHITIHNASVEEVVTIGADGFCNGEVGVWNRKGKGRKLTSN
jgi:hypothetical protein